MPRLEALMRNGVSGGREEGLRKDACSRSPASRASKAGSGRGWMLCCGNDAEVQGVSDGVDKLILSRKKY